jgi:hypothetical protein
MAREKMAMKKKKIVTNRRPAGKGRKKKNQRRFRHKKSLLPVPPQKTLPELSRHGRTDGLTQLIV